MKITEDRYDALVARGVTLREGLTELGIEIVPDPEPELPPRPWKVWNSDPEGTLNLAALDAHGRAIFWASTGAYERSETLRTIEALLSAYNAAGEKKRIEVEQLDRGVRVNGQLLARAGRSEAVGEYVRRYASDLGLEIVES